MPYIWYNLLPNMPIFWIIMETSIPLPYHRYNLVPDRLPELYFKGMEYTQNEQAVT